MQAAVKSSRAGLQAASRQQPDECWAKAVSPHLDHCFENSPCDGTLTGRLAVAALLLSQNLFEVV